MPPLRAVLIMVALIFAHAQVHAQQEEEETRVDLRFLFLDESGGSYSVELPEVGFRRISSYPYAISTSVSVPPGTRLGVYRNLPVPHDIEEDEEEAEPQRERIATVSTPRNTTDVLAVLRPAGGRNDYEVDYYNSDPDVFPPSTVRVLNLGRAPIGVDIGDQVERIEPGAARVIRGSPDDKHRLIVRVAKRNSEGWQILYSSVMVLRPEDRITGVVVFSPSGMRHTYTEAELRDFGDPPPRHQWLTYTDRL